MFFSARLMGSMLGLAAVAGWLFGACSSQADDEKNALSLKDGLPGQWRATGITIQVADSSAATPTLELDEAALREKPILWEFGAENRYRTTSGAQGEQSRGIWNVFGDTLMMIERRATYHYTVSLDGKKAVFKALLDWDGDGVEDDRYEGRFVRE